MNLKKNSSILKWVLETRLPISRVKVVFYMCQIIIMNVIYFWYFSKFVISYPGTLDVLSFVFLCFYDLDILITSPKPEYSVTKYRVTVFEKIKFFWFSNLQLFWKRVLEQRLPNTWISYILSSSFLHISKKI